MAKSSGGGGSRAGSSRGGRAGGGGGGGRTRGAAKKQGSTANTQAPAGSYAVPAGSPVGGRGVAKFPINTQARARNALARVQQTGTAQEKAMVKKAVASKYPALADRSSVIPGSNRTRGGGRSKGGKAK